MDLIHAQEVLCPENEYEIPRWNEGDAYVAGATWLFSEPQPSVRRIIDLSRMPWPPFEPVEGGYLGIGANCSYLTLEREGKGELGTTYELFRSAIRTLSSSFKTYSQATVGGNVCLAYAKSMMAPVFTSLGASYELVSPGPEGSVRRVSAGEFQIGDCETVRRPGEYLRRILIPKESLLARYALERMSYTSTSHAIALAIARADGSGKAAAEDAYGKPSISITFSAATTYPIHRVLERSSARDQEDKGIRERIRETVDEVCDRTPMMSDSHGSAEYRHRMLAFVAEAAYRRVAS